MLLIEWPTNTASVKLSTSEFDDIIGIEPNVEYFFLL